MGLKERAGSIKGKTLMTSFAAGQLIDASMTAVAINNYNATEISPFGGAELMRDLGQNEVFILKTAVTAILIGLYALSSIHEPTLKIKSAEIKAKYVLEKSLQAASIITWGVVALNSIDLFPILIKDVLAK